MKRISFIYMSFGRESSYRQALFSIFTLLGSKSQINAIYVVTDSPSFFRDYLNDHPLVRYVVIDTDDIREMRGAIDFIHRMKIAAIEKVMRADAEADRFMYIDSDTFVAENLDRLTDTISATDSLMHIHEYTFQSVVAEAPGHPTLRILESIRTQGIRFKHGEEVITVDDDFSSWNAGVLGLHASMLPLLDPVYALTEAIYPKHDHHAAEQYAFSYVLERNTTLHTCDEAIYHYWPAVKKEIAELFFQSLFDSAFRALSFSDRVARVMALRGELTTLFSWHYLALKNKAVLLFNEDRWRAAYYWSMRAVMRRPVGDFRFILDILYHTKRMFLGLFQHKEKAKIQNT